MPNGTDKAKLDYPRRVRKETVEINGVAVEFYRDRRKWHWRTLKEAVKVLTKGERRE